VSAQSTAPSASSSTPFKQFSPGPPPELALLEPELEAELEPLGSGSLNV
jgi:hypothetical protein